MKFTEHSTRTKLSFIAPGSRRLPPLSKTAYLIKCRKNLRKDVAFDQSSRAVFDSKVLSKIFLDASFD